DEELTSMLGLCEELLEHLLARGLLRLADGEQQVMLETVAVLYHALGQLVGQHAEHGLRYRVGEGRTNAGNLREQAVGPRLALEHARLQRWTHELQEDEGVFAVLLGQVEGTAAHVLTRDRQRHVGFEEQPTDLFE